MNLQLTFTIEEIQQILSILGEMPVKSGAAAVFSIIKERAERSVQEQNEPKPDEEQSNPEPV